MRALQRTFGLLLLGDPVQPICCGKKMRLTCDFSEPAAFHLHYYFNQGFRWHPFSLLEIQNFLLPWAGQADLWEAACRF